MIRKSWWKVLPVVLALALLSTGAWAAKRRPEAKPAATVEPAKPDGAPVVLDGRTLFFVRERVMSFTPEDRAGAIRRKLEMFLKDPLALPEAITVLEAETSTDIVAGETVFMTVTDRDAFAEGKPRAELAKEYAETLRASVRGHIEAYGNRSIVLGAAYTAAATLILVAFLVLFRKYFPRLYSAADGWKGTRIRSIRFQSVEVVNADTILAFIRGTLRWIRILATFLLFYVSYELNAYTDRPQVMAATYSHLHQNIQDVFNEAGVEIMSPHYSQIRDGNRMAVPDASLPPGYEPPAFRVERVPEDPRKDG